MFIYLAMNLCGKKHKIIIPVNYLPLRLIITR